MSPLIGRPSLEGTHLAGRALLLLVALLLAAAPASQLLAGSSWLMLTLVAAAPVILGGVVLRTVMRRQMLVPLAQAGLLLLLLVVVETVLGLARWQDGPVAVLGEQAGIVSRGVHELASGIAPLTLGAPGTLILVALIGLVTLLLDLMFLDLGWHTPTALAMMSSLLIPALQQPAGGEWWQIAAPVLAGAMIFATRTIHADPRYLRGDRRPQAGPPAHPGRTLGAVTLCLVLVAALTPAVGSALPQLAPARIALNIDLLRQWQDPGGPSLGPVMIDDDISVRRSLLQQQDTEVLRYTSTAEEPSYLRLRTLNAFDGEVFRSDVAGESLEGALPAFSDARDDGLAASGGTDDFVRTDVEIRSYAGNRLPVPENVRSLHGQDMSLNRALQVLPANGEVAIGNVPSGLLGQHYTIESEPATATAEQLRAVNPAQFEQPFDSGYTSSDEVPAAATELADQIVQQEGTGTGYDTAVAFQDYFRSTFAYSLTVTSPPGQDPLESFLQDRVGYCEQFAAAFALMMTSQGYPTRVVIGFTAGTQEGDEWSVTAKNAHAWPEVWFGPQYGWVRFEPTPAAAANGVNTPQRTESDTPEEGTAPTTEAPTTEAPTTEPSSEEETTEETTTDDPAAVQASDGGGIGPSEQTVQRVKWGVVVVMAAGGLLAAAAAVVVVGLRRRRLRARDERWAVLQEGAAPGAGASAAGGAGASAAGGAGAGASALAVEHRYRGAGELAWSELGRELSVRRVAIRWLMMTGAWGATPTPLDLDTALPPHRALEDLLGQIERSGIEVTAEHRAAAGRIADAFTTARYAAPLPAAPTAVPAPGTTSPVPESRTGANDAVIPPGSSPSQGEGGGRTVPESRTGANGPGNAPGSSLSPDGNGDGDGVEDAGSTAPQRAQHPLRRDADLLITLIRSVR